LPYLSNIPFPLLVNNSTLHKMFILYFLSSLFLKQITVLPYRTMYLTSLK
jgi:hypothetical protein